jgi:hypothetical protein
MSTENAEKQASSIRGSENDRAKSEVDPNGQSGASASSPRNGAISVGAAGANWTGSIIGGILSRMIAEKRSRIREVDECLEWYEREKVQREEELAELERLAAQIQSED